VNEAILALRREVAAIDPALTIFDAEPMTEYVAASLFGAKVAASLLSVLSGLGLLLAAIGLYSVMAYSVAQRIGEIGIRVALGAQPRDIMRLVIRQGIAFAVAGLVLGSLAAAALARVVSAMLVGVGPADPLVYASATGFTVLVTLTSAVILLGAHYMWTRSWRSGGSRVAHTVPFEMKAAGLRDFPQLGASR
jgi:putative ABC transport system permease protein